MTSTQIEISFRILMLRYDMREAIRQKIYNKYHLTYLRVSCTTKKIEL